uniref:Cytoskeleton associated protein 4 n=1 Tax=Cyprinus carpio carpio TaxID=630221 RepID=A0A8C1D6K5_CYPCA
MAAKNRNKSSSQPSNSDKTPASAQPDDAPRSRSAQRAAGAQSNNASGSPALLKLVSALCYLGFVAGTVIVSVTFYHELSEIKLASSRHEESVQRSADARQQIRSMQASLEALESAVLGVRTDLERTVRAAQEGEDNTRRLEHSLQNLRSQISQELTQTVREVKEARDTDASSLEERLSQLSRSTAESSFQQSRLRSELQELRTRLDKQDAPPLLKKELEALSSAVSEGNTAVLREQITAVSAEQQTRNREVASVSEDVEAVRTLLQSTAGSLRDEVSAARAAAQSASDQTQSLSDRLEQTSTALQSLETHTRDQLLQLEKHREDAEVRLKSVEEGQEVMQSSLTEQTSRLSALAAEHESQRRSLGDYKTSADTQSQALRDGLDGLTSRLEQLQTQVSELDAGQEEEPGDAI